MSTLCESIAVQATIGFLQGYRRLGSQTAPKIHMHGKTHKNFPNPWICPKEKLNILAGSNSIYGRLWAQMWGCVIFAESLIEAKDSIV